MDCNKSFKFKFFFFISLLQKLDFKFPLSVSCIHFICSAIGGYVVIKVLKLKPLITVDPEDRWRRIFPMSFVFCINIVLGNVSLRYIPVSFMQTIKSFTPATTGKINSWFWCSALCCDLNFEGHFHLILVNFCSCFAMASLEEIFWLAYLGFSYTHCWRDSSHICYRA